VKVSVPFVLLNDEFKLRRPESVILSRRRTDRDDSFVWVF